MKDIRNALHVLILCILVGNAIPAGAQNNYPVPVKTEKLLFYFQRSHNKNTVIYELNTLPDGTIDLGKPINAYWIRYEEGGVRKELSLIQLKAFGLQCKLVDKVNKSFVVHFNSVKDREISLLKIGRIYKAFIAINGEIAELTKMYIKAENNSIGIPLKVNYVEISGIDPKTGKCVTEKYLP